MHQLLFPLRIINSIRWTSTELNKDEPLPVAKWFRSLISCFIGLTRFSFFHSISHRSQVSFYVKIQFNFIKQMFFNLFYCVMNFLFAMRKCIRKPIFVAESKVVKKWPFHFLRLLLCFMCVAIHTINQWNCVCRHAKKAKTTIEKMVENKKCVMQAHTTGRF